MFLVERRRGVVRLLGGLRPSGGPGGFRGGAVGLRVRAGLLRGARRGPVRVRISEGVRGFVGGCGGRLRGAVGGLRGLLSGLVDVPGAPGSLGHLLGVSGPLSVSRGRLGGAFRGHRVGLGGDLGGVRARRGCVVSGVLGGGVVSVRVADRRAVLRGVPERGRVRRRAHGRVGSAGGQAPRLLRRAVVRRVGRARRPRRGRAAGQGGRGVPPHCSTRADVVNSPDSSGRSPPATGIDHWPVTSWPGADRGAPCADEVSSKAHWPVPPGW